MHVSQAGLTIDEGSVAPLLQHMSDSIPLARAGEEQQNAPCSLLNARGLACLEADEDLLVRRSCRMAPAPDALNRGGRVLADTLLFACLTLGADGGEKR